MQLHSKILSIVAVLALMVGITKLSYQTMPPQVINVFAGNDTYLCINENVNLTSLGATISGDVSDGDWITLGDGVFLPGNTSTVRFSTGTTYLPGPNDRTLGVFKLMLISDAPQNNPQAKVIDDVQIVYQAAPPIFCSDNLNISLNESCMQQVAVTMLQPNPQVPYSNYIIKLYKPNGQLIPNNILTKEHLEMAITFTLGHKCTPSTCTGTIRVQDYFPPIINCQPDTVSCLLQTSPEEIGFPFPNTAYIDTIINNRYIVKNWDACSDVFLTFQDSISPANCVRDEDKTIIRQWQAEDSKGNKSNCAQRIVVKRLSIDSVVFPLNFDDHILPAFECQDNYPVDSKGNPSIDTTGRPGIGSCGNLHAQYTDTRVNICGNSYKVIRNWFVIEWCASRSFDRNQIIFIKDSKGPKISCQDSIVLFASPYQCATERIIVPTLDSIADCSTHTFDVSIKDNNGIVLPQFIEKVQGVPYFVNVPVGAYNLVYTATDACNNQSTCSTKLFVRDNSAPYPACDQTTKVSLDNLGKGRLFATSLDDGSTDNCGIASFGVRRMTLNCSGNSTSFTPFIDFCCEDLNTTQMVALEVTDIHGNKNTCMVEVIVEDKIKPLITCPSNLSIACDTFYDITDLSEYGRVVTKETDRKNIIIHNPFHNGVIGRDGLATDNCSVMVTETVTTDIQCHTGRIYRKFIAIDANGRKDSCTQTIFVINPLPFSSNDITWPSDYVGDGCRSDQTSPDITGQPSFVNTSCGNIAANYTDLPFYIADGSCLKILRSWTVIDWCQFGQNNQTGRWGPHVQIIKLHNLDKPVFTSPCQDTTICTYSTSCSSDVIQLFMTAFDSCTPVHLLRWNVQLDLNNDAIIDFIDTTNQINRVIPYGTHRVVWKVEDQCGNFSTCSHLIEVIDCKKPTPYCYSSITTALMQQLGTVTIWAKDFNKDSYDNCTDTSGLLYTFNNTHPVWSLIGQKHYFTSQGLLSDSLSFLNGSAQIWIPEKNTSGLLFSCADIADGVQDTVQLTMTVIDESNNQDGCNVSLIIQDNANLCPDLYTFGTIAGKISSPTQVVPTNTTVNVTAIEFDEGFVINNDNGNYKADSLIESKVYVVTPEKVDGLLDGISILDILLIQRHILEQQKMTDPYKLIAADVNYNGSISAADIIELRKLILGSKESFPKNRNPWVFVPSNIQFLDGLIPFNFEEQIELEPLVGVVNDVDFTAIKLGDVNFSAIGDISNDSSVSLRGKNKIPVQYSLQRKENSSTLTIDIKGGVKDLEGMEIHIDKKDMDFDIKSIMSSVFDSYDYYDKGNSIHIIGYNNVAKDIQPDEPLFIFSVHNSIDVDLALHHHRNSTVVINNEAFSIELSKVENSVTGVGKLFRIANNPASTSLMLQNLVDGNAILDVRIIDSYGNVVYLVDYSHNSQFIDDYIIDLPNHLRSSYYILQVNSLFGKANLPFIKID